MEKSTITYHLNQPRYSTAEASRLIGITPQTTGRWLKGYEYKYQSERRKQEPVSSARKIKEKTCYASFLDLMDLLIVKEFRNRNFSLPKVRALLAEVEKMFGMGHFAHRKFFTAGKHVYTEMSEENRDLMQELLRGGQTASKSIIEKIAEEMEFDNITKLARIWYPPGMNNLVVVDPFISFGHPTIKGKGIPTRIIYSLYIAEGKDINAPIEWHDLTAGEARAAIEYEERLRLAA